MVTSRLVDEYKERNSKNQKSNKVNPLDANLMAQRKFHRCGMKGNTVSRCGAEYDKRAGYINKERRLNRKRNPRKAF